MKGHFNGTRPLMACLTILVAAACDSNLIESGPPDGQGMVTSQLETRGRPGGMTFESPPSAPEQSPRRQMRGVQPPAPPPEADPAGDDEEPQSGQRSAAIDGCPEEETITATGPALVFNDPDVLAGPLSLSEVLGELSESGGGPDTDGAQIAIISSALSSFGASAMTNSDSGMTVTMEPRTVESGMNPALFIADMLPVAVFNRLDLASETGGDCGEQRIIYSLDPSSALKSAPFSRQKFTMIFEARYPNPTPEAGIEGCQPVADFWASLVELPSNADRADALAGFFLDGVTVNGVELPAVIDVAHFQGAMGQIRTNQFMESPWQLREFRTAIVDGAVQLVPDTVKGNPLTALYNQNSAADLGLSELRAQFATDLIEQQIPLLLMPETQGLTDPNDILVSFEPAFANGFSGFTSESQGDVDDPAAQISPDLEQAIETSIAGTGVSTEQVLNRLGAMTCGGCHEFSAGRSITDSVDWPELQTAFVHVNDNGTLSDGLIDTFLPKRRQFLLETFFCDENEPECVTDDDCGAGFVCEGSTCVETEPECTADDDCAPNEICQSGVCVEDPDEPQECRTDRDCPRPQVCDAGQCVEPGVIDACQNPEARLTGPGTVRGSSSGQISTLSSACGGPGPEDAVVFRTRRSGTYCINTLGSRFDTVLSIRTAPCQADASELACNDDVLRSVDRSAVELDLEAGETYFLVIDSAVRGGGDWRLNVARGSCRARLTVDAANDGTDDRPGAAERPAPSPPRGR